MGRIDGTEYVRAALGALIVGGGYVGAITALMIPVAAALSSAV